MPDASRTPLLRVRSSGVRLEKLQSVQTVVGRTDGARVFVDHLRPAIDQSGLTAAPLLGFARKTGRVLHDADASLVKRRRGSPWGERERTFQLLRRGPYVEFNLLHDRRTTFGLQTGARVESVLMSLPPLAAWPDDPQWEPGTFEAGLPVMPERRDWA